MTDAAESKTDKPKRRRPSGQELADGLVDLLSVEQLDVDLYRGMRLPGGRGRVFGGQVIAQALMSAVASSDEERQPHSMHAYFMRPGDEDYPIIFRVERDYDGRSFATRRIIALQQGRPILNMAASFKTPEDGLSHQVDMPDVPGPDELMNDSEIAESQKDQIDERIYRWLTRPRPIELKPVGLWSPFHPTKTEPAHRVWFRATGDVGDSQAMHRAILAYASDMQLLGTCMRPHGVSWMTHKLQTASLDHAVWIHEDVKADEWMLYATDSPWSGHARGYNRGQIFSADGRLIASTAQEGLIRLRE